MHHSPQTRGGLAPHAGPAHTSVAPLPSPRLLDGEPPTSLPTSLSLCLSVSLPPFRSPCLPACLLPSLPACLPASLPPFLARKSLACFCPLTTLSPKPQALRPSPLSWQPTFSPSFPWSLSEAFSFPSIARVCPDLSAFRRGLRRGHLGPSHLSSLRLRQPCPSPAPSFSSALPLWLRSNRSDYGGAWELATVSILSVRIGRHTRVRTHKRAHTYTTLNQQTIGPNVQDPRSP